MFSKVKKLLSRAESLFAKFQQEPHKIAYIDEAITLSRKALNGRSVRRAKRSAALTQVARYLWHRYKQSGEIHDLDEAIDHERNALALRPPKHPGRPVTLNNLALYLSVRYMQLGCTDDLNEAIALGRDALALHPPGRTGRSTSLSNLALHLSTRYKQFGAIGDLNEAINLERTALSLRRTGHPGRSTSLSNFALHLATRYELLGEIDDLEMAIYLDREALALRPPGHLDRSVSLNNLALCLSNRYNELGNIGDLDEAIILSRDALELRPQGHPSRSISLVNLAHTLSTRYKRLGGIDDLDEAISLTSGAVVLYPLGHRDRLTCLSNLAGHLSTRHDQLGEIDNLEKAIDLDRDALALRPPGHPDRSVSLNNLALGLSNRHNLLGNIDDLDEAIILDREALELRPQGHPERSTTLSNLAFDLSARYCRLGCLADLNEAIILGRDTVSLRPAGHPGRSRSIENLANYLGIQSTHQSEAAAREELFMIYSQLEHVSQTASSSDLSAAKAWINVAENFQHPTVLVAYQTALRFLVQFVTSLPSLPHHHPVLKTLSSSLAADAFSACLRNNSLVKAVELLEQGRAVFWTQLARLRSPLDEVVASGPSGKALADKFADLTLLIRKALDSPGVDQHDRVYRLNSELQRVVTCIRELPDQSRFLLPPLFSNLQSAAKCGPVIIVNASKYGCDALIVLVGRGPIHVPLSITKSRVQELLSELRTLTKRAKLMDMTREFRAFLRELWDDVVSDIFEALSSTTVSHPSRVWWCPTAEFSLLPLHAANPYRQDKPGFSDLYISSYTPTLSALIDARKRVARTRSDGPKRFVAIGQATSRGTSRLCSISAELDYISDRVGHLTTFTRVEGEDASVSRVAKELCENEWVHIACHGILKKRPFLSAFALHDGHFTIEHVIRCDVKQAVFAYLSACYTTTVRDETSLDEVIHLACAMQFSGFPSVIGTMWAVDDVRASEISSVFYKHVVGGSDRLDYTRVAFALWKTMRSVNAPLDQRILYVHMGA